MTGSRWGDRTPVVTGLGAVSPIGSDTHAFWASVLTGPAGVGPVRAFDTSAFATHIGCEVRTPLDVAADADPKCGRTAMLAAAAAQEALAMARVGLDDRSGVGVCLGTTMGEACWIEGWPEAIVNQGPAAVPADELLDSGPESIGVHVVPLLGVGGPVSVIAGACAAGNYAIGRAVDAIRLGRVDQVLAGGADAFSRIAFTGFARLGALASECCRPFSAERDGLVLGEGAGMVFLESLGSARRRRASVLAEVAGVGLSCDAHHIVSPAPDGVGAARAIRAALTDAQVHPSEVDYVCAHGTGTPHNDAAEVAAMTAVFGPAGDVPMSSIKALTGHGLGAASALEAVACVLALQYGVVPPTHNFVSIDPRCAWDVVPNTPRAAKLEVVLNNASAFGGTNVSIAFRSAHDVGPA